MRTHKVYPYLLVAPALVLVVMVNLYPTLYSLYLSMTETKKGQMIFIGLKNFERILSSGQFKDSLMLTFIFVSTFVVLTTAVSFVLALLFNRGLRLGAVYMTLIFIPWVLSEIVSGVMWRWMFYRDYGVAQNLLGPLFGGVTLISHNIGAMFIVIIATVWRSIAFTMLLILAGLQTIPREVYEAAAIDGATSWQAFWRVTWPLALPITLVTMVYLSIQGINTVGMVLAITDGGPGRATEVLALHMYREAIQFFHFGYGAALSVVMLILNVILGITYTRLLQSESALAA